MKISQVKELVTKIFEEDDSLKYAIATNMAKYGRPNSRPGDKKAKLTKGLEKKREKHVLDLKKSMEEKMDPKEMKTGTYAGNKVVIHMHGPETEWKVEFVNSGKVVDYIDLMANLKFDDGTDYQDYLSENKEAEDAIRDTLSKEGGAAGLEPLVKAVKKFGIGKEELVKLLKKLAKVKKHRDGDYILTPISEDDEGSSFPGESPSKGYMEARKLIDQLRATTFKKLDNDELYDFRKTIATAFDMSLRESEVSHGGQRGGAPIDLSEDKADLDRIAKSLESQFDDLKFVVSDQLDRIDVRGTQQNMFNFGDKLQGKKFGEYEVFATDDDDRGEIVRIVKSDSISKGGVNERVVSDNEPPMLKAKIAAEDFMYEFRKEFRIVSGNFGKEAGEEFKNLVKAKIAQLKENTNEIEEKKSNPSMGIVRKKLGKVPKAGKVAYKKKMKLPTGLVSYMDYNVSEKKKKKDDRCTRIAKRKYDTWPSAYASGAVVRCRKGEIWKGIK